MKFINKFFTITLSVLLLIGLTACEDFFGDINTNPNNPVDVSVDVMMPAVQVEVADIYGGDLSRFSAILVQHAEGVARQWSSYNNYSSYVPPNFNTAWVNMYANILNEAVIMKTQAAENGFTHYEGVANILIAFSLMNATDVWNDIPYSQAFQGLDLLQVPFDNQTAIYTEINNLLASALTLVKADDGGNGLGSDDLIYGGDMALWEKAANGLLARGRLHLGDYPGALSAAQASFASAGEEMNMQYQTSETAAGPWYRFNRDRTGDIELHPTFAGLLTSNNDTMRLNVLSPTFNPDHPYLVPDYNQPMLTYREMQFIIAECLMRTSGAAADIQAAYEAGVSASFDHFGVSGAYADYIAQPSVATADMNRIMTEKWIALWGTPEAYNDWRRSNIPALTPNSGSTIPVRFPYGNDEVLFNPNTPSVDIFTDKVGWDN